MDQGPWQPILERSAGEAAFEAARAIASALATPSGAISTPSASLAGGAAGEAPRVELYIFGPFRAVTGEAGRTLRSWRLRRCPT